MENRGFSNLVELIYDTAADVDLWPVLLQGLAIELDADVSIGKSGPAISDLIRSPGEFVDSINAKLSHVPEQKSEVSIREFTSI